VFFIRESQIYPWLKALDKAMGIPPPRLEALGDKEQ
jgi:hypothetical protein